MADFEVEKEYSEQLRKLETADPAHADLFNSMFSTLINNDAYLNEQNNKIKQPEFDDSGSIDEIVDFPSFLSSMVSKMSIFKFFSDLKAGLKFVLHTGQIVNNCVTDRSDLPGSAHNDKVLMDKYLALSSDLNSKLSKNAFYISSTNTIADLYSAYSTGIILIYNNSTNVPSYGSGIILRCSSSYFKLLLVDDDSDAMYLWTISGSSTALITSASKTKVF